MNSTTCTYRFITFYWITVIDINYAVNFQNFRLIDQRLIVWCSIDHTKLTGHELEPWQQAAPFQIVHVVQ